MAYCFSLAPDLMEQVEQDPEVPDFDGQIYAA